MMHGFNQLQYSGETDEQHRERCTANDKAAKDFAVGIWRNRLPMPAMRDWAEEHGVTEPKPNVNEIDAGRPFDWRRR